MLVVDAKNWTGQIEVRGGVLYQGSHSREKETTGALEQSAALTVLLEPRHRHTVQAWLCMVGQPEMRARSASGVRIQGLNTLTDAVAALPHVLDPVTVQAIHVYLKQLLTGPLSPGTHHQRPRRQRAGPWQPAADGRTGGFRASGLIQASSPYLPWHAIPGTRHPSVLPISWKVFETADELLRSDWVAHIDAGGFGMLTNLATHITYGLTHASPHPAPAITTTVPHQ